MTSRTTIRFTSADQRRFATLSGDVNPVHLDAVASRRVAAGEPIVHGMHLLLRALEIHFARMSAPPRVTLEATFLRPAFLNEPIRVESMADGTVSVQADGDVALAVTKIGTGSGQPQPPPAPLELRTRRKPADARRVPAVRTLADVTDAAGVIDLPSMASVRRAFPRVARTLGAHSVAALAGISRLAGMECPGRDSLLSSLRVDLRPRARAERFLWRVARVDRRFGLVRIDIWSEGINGTVDAFLRPAPPAPPSIAAAATRLTATEFAGQRALIIGGSRGLGAATAMLLAAGGGLPVITYAAGVAEAVALQRDAQAASRRLEMLHFDIRHDDAATILQDAAARFGITHLYYFATPRIFARRREPFDDRLFERFTAFYVAGFARVCAALGTAIPALDVFYPSSAAVEEPASELTEYAAAKAAGECLCRLLDRPAGGLRILVRRLPRVSTDQTASIVSARAIDALDAVLPIVREMQRRVRARD